MSDFPLRGDKRSAQLRKLTEISRALTYAVSLSEVLDLTVRRAAELLEADRAVLMLTNDEGLLTVRASVGIEARAQASFSEPLHETLVTRLTSLMGTSVTEPFLGVPLVVAGEVTGLLAVAKPPGGTPHEDDEWLLSALADQAAVALEKTRLDETAEFRERLIGIVSHDLRNPISVILIAAQSLQHRERLDSRTIDKLIARIHGSADRAGAMIRDLLDFTQARLGGFIPLGKKAGDLHAIVRQVVEEMEVAYPDRLFEVSHRGGADGQWDEGRMAQAVGNLLSNAIAYGTPGTPILVTTIGEPGYVSLTVHNQGPSIPPEFLLRLFEPMLRASAELNNSNRSVGLGLYIVKHIAEAHGGTATVHSEDGFGTEFRLHLPV